jgi:MFS family permease
MNDPTVPFVGFYWSHRVGLLLVSLSFMVLVLELVRREHLKERYALLWLAAAACGLGVGVFPSLITWMSTLFGFQYLTVFFVGSFLFLLMLVLAFTVVISTLSERNRTLAQEVALLARRVEELEGSDRET